MPTPDRDAAARRVVAAYHARMVHWLGRPPRNLAERALAFGPVVIELWTALAALAAAYGEESSSDDKPASTDEGGTTRRDAGIARK